MAKKMWKISSADITNPITGEKGNSALVHSKEDLNRRVAEAKKAGITLKVEDVD